MIRPAINPTNPIHLKVVLLFLFSFTYILLRFYVRPCLVCYNYLAKHISPPVSVIMRWAGIEPAGRIHGSAVQMHRVYHFTTSACKSGESATAKLLLPLTLSMKNIILFFNGMSIGNQKYLALNYNSLSIVGGVICLCAQNV